MYRFVLLILYYFLYVGVGYAQQKDLTPILLSPNDFVEVKKVLKDFQVFDLKEQYLNTIFESSNRNNSVNLTISDQLSWEIILEPVEILNESSPIYALTPSGKESIRHLKLPKAFKGTFADGRLGEVRLTVNENFLYGFIAFEDKEYYIEPLKYFVESTSDSGYIIYEKNDVKEDEAKYSCHRQDDDAVREVIEQKTTRGAGNCYKVKLAVLADYSMFIDPAHSGLDAVVNHLVGVMNNVQAHYELNGSVNFSDGINFEISELVISTCATCDPISGTTNASTLLSEFSTWVDDYGFESPFNASHFWTNRDFIGSTVGMAYQSSNLYCSSNARAVLEDWTSTAALLKIMVSHEMGHNFNGTHDAVSNFILSPTVTITSQWSTNSQATIGTQIANQGTSCLANCVPELCTRIQNTAVSNITNVSFNLSWNTSSTGLYTIKVKELDSPNFIVDVTTINNFITLSPVGYGICKKYDVFIFNNCGNGNLSAPVRLLITGPTSQGCAEYTVAKTVGWPGDNISFTDKSLNASSWFWDFGNGQTSTLQNPTVTYSTNNYYTVSLTVNGIHTNSKQQVVKILPNMGPSFGIMQGGNFESNENYFASSVIEGTVDVWERGISTVGLVSNGNAWKSKLNANVPKVTSKSGLFTPKFNMTGWANYTLEFDLSLINKYRNGPYATQLQYSTNGGNTWTRLGDYPSFYNNGNDPFGFYKIASQVFSDFTGWTSEFYQIQNVHKTIDISFLSGQPSVIFRFVFSVSNVFTDGYNEDGVLFDNFALSAANQIILPLNINSLVGEKQPSTTKLNWSAYNTGDISHFVIEKSIDGTNFFEIGKLNNTKNLANDTYSYYDQFPLTGKNFYRVKAISHSSKAEFTNVVELVFGDTREILIYPNPLENNIINIDWKENKLNVLGVEIVNSIGDKLYDQHISAIDNAIILDNMIPGVYYLMVKFQDGSIMPHKLVKL